MASSDDLLAPISDESPTGADVSFDSEYSQIGPALAPDQDGAPAGPGSTEADFEEVVELATTILAEKSKDLTVAAWLTAAQLGLHGFSGLAAGLRLMHGIMEQYWDGAFPEEPEGRLAAVEFVGTKLLVPLRLAPLTDAGHTLFHYEEWKGVTKDSFAGDAPPPQDGEDLGSFESGFLATPKARYKELDRELTDCSDALGQLQAMAKEKFGDAQGAFANEVQGVLAFTNVKKVLARIADTVGVLLAQKLEMDPDPVEVIQVDEAPASGADQDSAPSTTPAAAPAGLAPEPRDASDAATRIAASARFLRRADPTNPAPYLLLRGFRWGELRATGDQLNVRLLDSPPMDVRKHLKTLLLNEEWDALVDAGEEVMAGPYGRGWLDLQRYVVTALENLGGKYVSVANAILDQMRILLADLPQLAQKAMMDDTATANAETLSWMARSGLMGESDGAAAKTQSVTHDQDRALADATYERAMEWVASGSPQKGIELLMKRAKHERSERARFITESHAAAVMVQAGMDTVAKPILEDLVATATQRQLDDWEAGEVVARPLGLLYRCLPPNDPRRSQLYQQIARLDPIQAMGLESGSATQTSQRQEPSEPTQVPGGPAVGPGPPDQQA